ncbi:MAG: hypothetical protein WCK36_04790 [Candidatus Firestonebacteria bacterium]
MFKAVTLFLFIGTALFAYECPDVNIQVFPKDNPWNWNISKADVHKKSEEYIKSIGPEYPFLPWFGARLGIPYSLVAGGKEEAVEFIGEPEESDKGPYRIPLDAPREAASDARVIVIDTNNHNLYELLQGRVNPQGYWLAYSGAIFNLDSNNLRKENAYSADCAGLPIFPGLIRFQDISRGEMNHAVRVVVPRVNQRYVYPARNSPALEKDDKLPAVGQRFRLKAEVDITKLGIQAQIIAAGLKKHGFIVADRGYKPYCYGTLDERWNDKDLATLQNLKLFDFEAVVELTSLSLGALDPCEKVKVYGSPFIRGKSKVGLMNVPAGKYQVKVLDAKKVLVRQLENKGLLLAWDMKDAAGKDVAPGNYLIIIEDSRRVMKELPVKIE